MKKSAILLAAAMLIASVAQAQPRTATIMITAGEEQQTCAFGNMSVAWIVMVRRANGSRAKRRYVSSLDVGTVAGSCAQIPITAPVGSEITITGLIQGGRLATEPFAPSFKTPTVNESCWNVEAFSVGLAPLDSSEINPLDPTNVINPQGFGLFWALTDATANDAATFAVTGCSGRAQCRLSATTFNTDQGAQAPTTDCIVLAPIN